MFFPRSGRARRLLVVKSVDGEWIRAERDDGARRRLALDNLLAVDEAGNGIHYRFQGWKPRPRGYRTELRVQRVDLGAARCSLVLPEWDPETSVDELLGALPPALRSAGATGSCMANLASPSAAGLAIHSVRPIRARGLSRPARGAHPETLAAGQSFKRRSDGTRFRILEASRDSETVPAWSGQRTVRLTKERLLARTADGEGRYYVYLGGGVRAARALLERA